MTLKILDETQKAKESNKELKEKDKQKDEFLDAVAHELKTSITLIRALSEILLDNKDIEFETKTKSLNSIVGESDRVSRLINNILDLEKLATGKGIGEDELALIFDKFYQSKNQNILKPKGSGLGLAISKQIIESHNGKIWAQNIKPHGARITFTLPINLN